MGFSRLMRSLFTQPAGYLGRRLALCVLVGLVAGFGAVGFFYMLEFAKWFCMDYLANYHPGAAGQEASPFSAEATRSSEPIRRWVLLIIPAIGGLISGVIVFTLAPEAEGHGTDAAIEAYHFKGGRVRARVPLIKALTSAITIGSGGSGGREGPIAQIGSGFGSLLAQALRLSPHERRILMASGMAAGIGAIFHAPLAGALFAAEVMYKELDIEHEILVPAFVASVIAYAVFGSFFGFHPLFITPNYKFDDPWSLLPFTVLAVVCAVGAAAYVTAFYGVRRLVLGGLRIPNHFKPAIGGLLVGVIGFFLPEALGTGYGVVQACFYESGPPAYVQVGDLPSWGGFLRCLPDTTTQATAAMLLLAVIAVAKIATTALSIGSGGSGGVFGPAIVIGGALGGATGILCGQFFPSLHVAPGSFALVGMAGFFAAAANTPISTIIMVSEMTGAYNLLMPSMLVCTVAYVLCRRFDLYRNQISSHFEAPSQVANMATAVLKRLTVGQALVGKADRQTVVVPFNATFAEVMARFAHSIQSCLPVVDAENRLTGVIDSRDIRRVIREPGFAAIVSASDLEVPATTLAPDDSLLSAMQRMIAVQRDELVVVKGGKSAEIVGTLSRSDVVSAYDRYLLGGHGGEPRGSHAPGLHG